MYDFLADLDEYFCEKYANYDKLYILPGYKTPVMQATTVDEFGRSYSYTLPSENLRLALQEKKTELLSLLKTKLEDKTFSFSFRPVGVFSRVKNCFSKFAPHRVLKSIVTRYGEDLAETGKGLSISEEIWTGICKGKFYPTKNLIFSLALSSHWTEEDVNTLFVVCGYEWDFACQKDVVILYLLQRKIFDRGMIDAAFAEYKIRNLFM